jgi:tripartite-type tricarboxylate transporter receptor subunit TctC
MHKKIFLMAIGFLAFILVPWIAFAAAPFYEGKTIRLIVGFPAGGGFDTYSRLVARHLGKNIPGNPTVIVENMPGGGSLIAAKHLFRRVKPDGLTLGNLTSQLVMAQILGREGMDIDMRKFEYLGAPVQDNVVCGVLKSCGVTSLDQWIASQKTIKIGGDAPGSVPADSVKILKTALDLPVQIVVGYPGTREILMAAESGEVCGGCWQWESMKVIWAKGLTSGDVSVILQATAKPIPDLPKVPVASDFAKSEEGRQLIKAGIYEPASITRLHVLPPGAPKDLLQILRKAFMDTMKDPGLLQEANKAKLTIHPLTGEEMEKTVEGLFNLDPNLVKKLKEVLHPSK